MTLTVFFGIAGLTLLSAIAVPAIVVLGSYSVWPRCATPAAGGAAAGDAERAAEPLDRDRPGGRLVRQRRHPHRRLRPLRPQRAYRRGGVPGGVLPRQLADVHRRAGAAAVGKSDISDVMIAQGLLIPAILVLGLNIWTTNDNALYASGLGFANITGLLQPLPWRCSTAPRHPRRALAGQPLRRLADLPLRRHPAHRRGDHRRLPESPPALPPAPCADIQAINRAAILAVACGTAAGHWPPGIVPVNAVLGAAIAYLLLNPLPSRSPNKPEEVLHAD